MENTNSGKSIYELPSFSNLELDYTANAGDRDQHVYDSLETNPGKIRDEEKFTEKKSTSHRRQKSHIVVLVSVIVFLGILLVAVVYLFVSCKIKENIYEANVCPEYTEIENGQIISASGNKHGDVIEIQCDVRSNEAASRKITCLSSGTWSDVAKCVLKSCDDYVVTDHIQIISKTNDTTVGAKVIVRCKDGYELYDEGLQLNGTGVLICQANGQWTTGPTCHHTETDQVDCAAIRSRGKTEDGVYNISLWKSGAKIQAYCDMSTAGGGWTVFQRRYDGSVEFYRPFSEYENGFGDLKTEFWLGLKYIQEIAARGTSELRIDLEAANGTKAFETFSNFSLTGGSQYKLNIGPTSSSLNILDDSVRNYHNGHAFTTYDRDLDSSSGNCAQEWRGAWWYNSCHKSNLNGDYLTPGTKNNWKGVVYDTFSYGESMKSSKMMLRRVKDM